MKKLLTMALVAALAFATKAEWSGLDDSNWFSGPKLTEADLTGKVILVDLWGIACPPCKALLPKMESTWLSFKSKPFMLIGSHRQGKDADEVMKLVKKNNLTYPIYQWVGIKGEPSNGGGLPFMYVLNHRGKVVYSGRSHPEAIEAVVNALGEVNGEYSLTAGAVLKNYKAMEKQLVFGKPIKSLVSNLKRDIKAAEKKSATAAIKAKAEEAEKILKSIDEAKDDIKADIELAKEKNPPEAVKLITKFNKTFADDPIVAEYKAGMAELNAKAKAWAAEQKAKGKAK